MSRIICDAQVEWHRAHASHVATKRGEILRVISQAGQWEARIPELWPIRGRAWLRCQGRAWHEACEGGSRVGERRGVTVIVMAGIVTVSRGTPEDKWQVTRFLTCDTRTVVTDGYFLSFSNPYNKPLYQNRRTCNLLITWKKWLGALVGRL